MHQHALVVKHKLPAKLKYSGTAMARPVHASELDHLVHRQAFLTVHKVPEPNPVPDLGQTVRHLHSCADNSQCAGTYSLTVTLVDSWLQPAFLNTGPLLEL
jgi:hypothetical protein